jgi:hypothetical protein
VLGKLRKNSFLLPQARAQRSRALNTSETRLQSPILCKTAKDSTPASEQPIKWGVSFSEVCSKMPFPAIGINVMIASPSDVEQVRRVARDVVHEWNDTNAQEQRVVLLPMGWESHSSPRMGDRPQAIINTQLLNHCDLLVAIFWTQLGTATGEAASGTVEEITKHVAAGKTAMVYFSNAPIFPASINHAQYDALLAFRKKCTQQGLFHEFSSLEQFRDDFRRHLALTIQRYFGQDALATMLDFATPGPQTDSMLTEDARDLLLESSRDRHGCIMWVSSAEGLDIQTNDKSFVESNNPRSEARWKEAVQELEHRGLIERESSSMLSITNAGYKLVDRLVGPTAS